MAINNITLVGCLGANAEVKETSKGKKIAILQIEVDNGYKNSLGQYIKDVALFICVTYRTKLAESLEKLAKKGLLVGIEGRLLSRGSEYENGVSSNIAEVEIDHIEYL